MPAALTTAAHFTVSLRRKVLNSSGELATISAPSIASFSRISFVRKIPTISFCNRVSISVGVAAGAIIGGAFASPYYYGYGPRPYYDGYAPYYAPPPPPPAYMAEDGGDVSYCMRRFKSYDPRSGTYLGFDGNRHPCP